jgi:hypothetical protein
MEGKEVTRNKTGFAAAASVKLRRFVVSSVVNFLFL